MSHTDARRLIGTVVYYLGLTCVIALILSLPAIWLAWEAGESHARAALVADANASREMCIRDRLLGERRLGAVGTAF